jgi:hypothetical protein
VSLKDHKDDPEYVKSNHIYIIANYVNWPATVFNFSMSPFMIGLYGKHEINNALFDTLRDRRIKDRDWKADYYVLPQQIRHCHLLLVSGITTEELASLIQFISKKKILTLGDNIENFCQSGGMINLAGLHPDYKYEINLNALKNAGLGIQEEFLSMATTIE